VKHNVGLGLGGICLAAQLVACGGSSNNNTIDAPAGTGDAAVPTDLQPPAQGFQVKSPELTIMPGQEITYCYYFKFPTTTEVGVKKWQSRMTSGSHHMIVYLTKTEQKPAGTVDTGCGGVGGGGAGNIPVWTYSAQNQDAEAVMPTGIGMTIAAAQPAYVQMHYLNTTDAAIKVHVTLNGDTYATTDTYTKAAAFVTYTSGFSVPPGNSSVSKTCDLAGAGLGSAKFFTMSTHTHKQGVKTYVKDGSTAGTQIFSATDWEHPGAISWMSEPFYTFPSGKLYYQCDYTNPGTTTIVEGQSAQTNEMCMAVGYFFPATTAKFCVNGLVF
jgi:hypothetical protein